jgi:hypothetical protein
VNAAHVQVGSQSGQLQGFGGGRLSALRLVQLRRWRKLQRQLAAGGERGMPRQELADGRELQRLNGEP